MKPIKRPPIARRSAHGDYSPCLSACTSASATTPSSAIAAGRLYSATTAAEIPETAINQAYSFAFTSTPKGYLPQTCRSSRLLYVIEKICIPVLDSIKALGNTRAFMLYYSKRVFDKRRQYARFKQRQVFFIGAVFDQTESFSNCGAFAVTQS